ncbi:MAG TPA: Ig-like domain-containing protein [Gaiellaceae bacterium]
MFPRHLAIRLTARPGLLLAAAALALLLLASSANRAGAATICTRYAAPSGSDSSPGTATAPFASVQKLAGSLSAGGTGCLLGGTYAGNVTITAGGAAGAPLTLTTAPGFPQATIHGVIGVTATASYVTLDNLHVDATNASQLVAVQLYGDYGRLTNSDLFGADQTGRIGAQIGYSKVVKGVEIDHDRIHNFGSAPRFYDHGIYVDLSNGALVHDNTIYDNEGGFGIQLWTGSQNGKFYDNTIDGNGAGSVIIGGQTTSYSGPSSNNEFYGNIFSNPGASHGGYNVNVFWSGGVAGTGNSVHDNCVSGGDLMNAAGVSYASNRNSAPAYLDASHDNFTLGASSPCAGYGASSSSSSSSGTEAAPEPPGGTSSIAAGSKLAGTVNWTVTTTGSVAAVEFWANGKKLVSIAAPQFTTKLDTTELPNGANLLSDVLVAPDGTRTAVQVGSVTVANPPTAAVAPVVTGVAAVDRTLAASPGTWSGLPATLAYAWLRCDTTGAACSPIAGATSSSYTVASADSGSTLRVAVTATSSGGSTTATSLPTAAVPTPTGGSSIANGALLTGLIPWTASPPAGTTSVEFWVDGQRLATETAAPYAYALDTTRYANGSHIVGVAWTDRSGVRHPASPAQSVNVVNAVSSIGQNAALSGTITWTATLPAGARSVEFWVDNQRLAILTSTPYVYHLDTRKLRNGSHIVGVAWTDAAGLRHPASPAVPVTVKN